MKLKIKNSCCYSGVNYNWFYNSSLVVEFNCKNTHWHCLWKLLLWKNLLKTCLNSAIKKMKLERESNFKILLMTLSKSALSKLSIIALMKSESFPVSKTYYFPQCVVSGTKFLISPMYETFLSGLSWVTHSAIYQLNHLVYSKVTWRNRLTSL